MVPISSNIKTLNAPLVETGPLDALALVQTMRGKMQGGIAIYGEPLHAPPAELAKQLASEGLETFLVTEARHSVGNYAVVLREEKRITVITAPGYGGGYIRLGARHLALATTMADALGLTPDPIEADPFGMSFYFAHAPASNFNMLPFTTMFRGLRRLPPGSVAVLEKARLTKFETYLNLDQQIEPPETFRAALQEVAGAIVAYVQRSGRKVVLMFSGGAGAVALWLVLRDRLSPEQIRLVCIDYPGTNGPARAVPVARALGAEIEIIDPHAPQENQTVAQAALIAQMTRDTMAFLSPHVPLLGQDNLLILNGQNFDVLTHGNMEVLNEFHEAGYLSEAALRITSTESRVLRRDRAFINNMAFTDSYLADDGFQKLSAPFFAAQMREANPDPTPGPEGALRGLISRRFPNVLSPARYPLKQVQHLNGEIALLDDYMRSGKNGARMRFDLMAFLATAQTSAKRQAGLPLGTDTEMVLPAMSGPLASYYMDRPRGLSEVNQPKREIYALIRSLGGMAYRSLIKADPNYSVPAAPQRPALEKHPLFEIGANLLKSQQSPSPLLEGLREPAVRAYMFEALEKLSEGVKGVPGATLTEFQKNLLIRVGNLLSILETARMDSKDMQTISRTPATDQIKEDQ